RARFKCSKHFTVTKAVVAHGCTGLAQGNYFSVGCRIAVGQVAIPSSPDNLPIVNDNRSDRYLACLQGALSGAQSLLHPKFVSGRQSSVVSLQLMRRRGPQPWVVGLRLVVGR